MGRKVREAQLDNRTARTKLAPRAEPYWRVVSAGGHVGYYRGIRVGKWVARHRRPGAAGGYHKTTIGEADDVRDADGATVLSFSEAQLLARQWFTRIANGGTRVGPYTVGDALDDYLTGFGGKSVVDTKSRIETLIRPVLGGIALSKLTTQQVFDWHSERAAAPARLRSAKAAKKLNQRALDTSEAVRRRRSTANRDLTVLRAALNKAWRGGKVETDSAWRKVKPFKKVEKPKLRYLSEAESRRLVNSAAPAIRPLIQAALLTGARYGELGSIKVADVDFAAETVWLHDTKAGVSRVVYLEAEGLELFRQQCAGRTGAQLVFARPGGERWGASHQARPVRDACALAKIEPVASFHDLRRTYGARLALCGVPLAVIAEALGHADERITRRHYAHLAPSYVADTVRKHVAGLNIVKRSNVASITA